jgi:hypothetical protein
MKTVYVLIGVALLSAGPLSLLMPEAAAAAFGIPADTPHAKAYLLATATRDVALGCWLLAFLGLRAGRRPLAASMLAIALVAAGDAANVVVHAGWNGTPALVVHIGGLGGLLALAWRLWRTNGG